MAGDKKKTDARWRRCYRGWRIRTILALWRPALHAAISAGVLLQSAGCSRPYFRKDADKEVAEILAKKDKYPDWKIDNWHVYADPRARFADNSDPDHPPMPPDDPAAHDMSPNPQKPGKAGVKRIEGTGYLELIAQMGSGKPRTQGPRGGGREAEIR